MSYLWSQTIKKNPELYKRIEEAESWILKENYILKFFDKQERNVKVLDIGCGNGLFLDRLKEMGFENLFGADLGNYLKNKDYEHQAVDINVEKLKYPDKFFGIITAFQVLEHLENYFLILQEAVRTLKDRSYFIISIPNQFNIFYRIKFMFTGNMTGFNLKNNHLLFLTKDVFQKTFLRYFDLVDTYYSRGPIPMFGRLNIIPGINIKTKKKFLPRHSLLANRVCYVLRKK